ncbi:MAG: aminotransferase class III-fold pyridoxal phosphate-dependent enzyme [Clostridiales bacterium]|nr:aminotransferase class III-fold pyridoxal phosphate-dependent enzyme [Clostridiales bacterium]
MNIMDMDKAYVAGTYKRFPVEIVSGKGSHAVDSQGKTYVDMGSGIGVTAFGYGDEAWKAAVCAQLDKVQHTSNLYYNEPCARLAKLLCEKTGMKKVFFSNSGAEANECAIKAARKYSAEKKGTDCYTIVTLQNSFHGRTLTTLAATGQDHFHQLYQPLTPGFVHVPANDIQALKDCVAKVKVAGILMEVVQGEGGVLPLTAEYLAAANKLAHEQDIPLMMDEVQIGNGRSGKLYGYMNFDVQPDIVSTAKGLGGGLPIGACLLGEKVQNVLGFGDHGSTYGGNPVCCAGGVSIIGRLTDDFLAEVQKKSAYVFQTLTGAPGIESVTGLGLMIGVKPVAPAAEVVKKCMERGVLCLTAKNKVRLLPALNIPMEDLKFAVETIRTVAAELA